MAFSRQALAIPGKRRCQAAPVRIQYTHEFGLLYDASNGYLSEEFIPRLFTRLVVIVFLSHRDTMYKDDRHERNPSDTTSVFANASLKGGPDADSDLPPTRGLRSGCIRAVLYCGRRPAPPAGFPPPPIVRPSATRL